MKSVVTAIASLATLVGFLHTASANKSANNSNKEWSHTQDFQYAKTASIRIVEPEGYKVSVNGQTEQVPAVFKFSNENNYHSVTVTAADGKVWTKKIEVRAHKETVLRVKYNPAKKATPAKTKKKGRSYIGNVKNKCSRKQGLALRFDFLLGGEKQASKMLRPGQNSDLTLGEGSYEIRVFAAGKRSKQWKFWKTFKNDIKADGWKFGPKC